MRCLRCLDSAKKAQEVMRPSAQAAILLPPAALSAESLLGLTASSLVYRIDANHLPVQKLQEVMGSRAKAATLLTPAVFWQLPWLPSPLLAAADRSQKAR